MDLKGFMGKQSIGWMGLLNEALTSMQRSPLAGYLPHNKKKFSLVNEFVHLTSCMDSATQAELTPLVSKEEILHHQADHIWFMSGLVHGAHLDTYLSVRGEQIERSSYE